MVGSNARLSACSQTQADRRWTPAVWTGRGQDAQSLKGHNDLLIFTKPDMVKDIHKECFLAGSDICETNTFNLQRHHGVRPTSRTLSLSPGVEDLSFRNATWDELVEAYTQPVSGLVDGGVNLLMIETVFDTQNCKAIIFAVDEYFMETKTVMLSVTMVDNSGLTLSGQTWSDHRGLLREGGACLALSRRHQLCPGCDPDEGLLHEALRHEGRPVPRVLQLGRAER